MLAFSRFTDGNHTLGYILRIGIARSLGVHSTNVIRKSQCFSENSCDNISPTSHGDSSPFSTIFPTLELIGSIISPTLEFIGLWEFCQPGGFYMLSHYGSIYMSEYHEGRESFHTLKNLFKKLVIKCISLLCHTACGILVPQPGISPGPLHWKLGVLTIGPPGKSWESVHTSLGHSFPFPLQPRASSSLCLFSIGLLEFLSFSFLRCFFIYSGY